MIRSLLQRDHNWLTLYLPILAMGLLALGSWQLARHTPEPMAAPATPAARTEPDYTLRRFAIKAFDPAGALANEIWGSAARHFPQSDTLEIEQARFRFVRSGTSTLGQADRALSNADGSQVQLLGNATVVRQSLPDAQVQAQSPSAAQMEIRGDFLHLFLQTEKLQSHKPVTVLRGKDQFSADTLTYDKLQGQLNLQGRVRAHLAARP